jgi:hypothetical protein
MQYPEIKDLLVGYPAGLNLSMTARIRMRAMGLTPGMPDLQLLVPRIYPLKLLNDDGTFAVNDKRLSCGLFVEMKRKNGKVSPVQSAFHRQLAEQFYTITVCYSFEEAQLAIRNYLVGYKKDFLNRMTK